MQSVAGGGCRQAARTSRFTKGTKQRGSRKSVAVAAAAPDPSHSVRAARGEGKRRAQLHRPENDILRGANFVSLERGEADSAQSSV